MATQPLDISNVRTFLEYVFSRQSFWTLSTGHTVYMTMVRNNAFLLSEYLRTLDSVQYNAWVVDVSSF